MLKRKIHKKLVAGNDNEKDIYLPIFFRPTDSKDKENLERFLDENPGIKVADTIMAQLKELVKARKPAQRLSDAEIEADIAGHLGGTDPAEYGVWVYYPWTCSLVHVLDEQEFVELRTNRNKYKITGEEQALLGTKTIGIIGLSVGQSIALTMAMERVCGHFRLADFDTADLSNLNRLRTGVGNIGIKKTVIAAREMLELDPYLDVRLYSNGVTDDNIDDFFAGGGKIDLLVEVCDGLDMKVLSRYKAKELRIPVVMDTNDRGMLDVERFDLEPAREVLHGLAEGLNPQTIKGLSNEEKIPYVLKMVGVDSISTRLKASMLEMQASISTWPQLASSVALGGGLTTDICRRILLGQYHDSGRYYIDFDELISDKKKQGANDGDTPANPFRPIERTDIESVLRTYFEHEPAAAYLPSAGQVGSLADAAMAAPSPGNNQPWKWAYKKGVLFLFHDQSRSWSWGDYYGMGSFMSLGTAIENVHLQAALLNLEDETTMFPLHGETRLVCAIRFGPAKITDNLSLMLAENLYKRYTNRKVGKRQQLPPGFLGQLAGLVNSGGDVALIPVEDSGKLDSLGKIISSCDRMRLLHQQGHEEFYNEIRWTKEQVHDTRDGIDLASACLTPGEMAAFSVARDWKAVQLLAKWEKGEAFKRLSVNGIDGASALAVFAIPEFTPPHLIAAGRAVEKAWIFANMHGISVQPFLSSCFFFNRLVHGQGEGIQAAFVDELTQHNGQFARLTGLDDFKGGKYTAVFIMKLSLAEDTGIRSLRKPKSEVFFELT